jgi:hypothetical protein
VPPTRAMTCAAPIRASPLSTEPLSIAGDAPAEAFAVATAGAAERPSEGAFRRPDVVDDRFGPFAPRLPGCLERPRPSPRLSSPPPLLRPRTGRVAPPAPSDPVGGSVERSSSPEARPTAWSTAPVASFVASPTVSSAEPTCCPIVSTTHVVSSGAHASDARAEASAFGRGVNRASEKAIAATDAPRTNARRAEAASEVLGAPMCRTSRISIARLPTRERSFRSSIGRRRLDTTSVGRLNPGSGPKSKPATGSIIAEISLPAETTGGVAAGAGGIWVAENVHGLERIDPATNEVTDEIEISDGTSRLAVNYVATVGDHVVVKGGWAALITDEAGSPDYQSTGKDGVASIDPRTDTVTWTIAIRRGRELVVGDGSAWLTSDSQLVQLDLNGRGAMTTEPVRTDGRIVAIAASAAWTVDGDGHLVALRPRRGSKRTSSST